LIFFVVIFKQRSWGFEEENEALRDFLLYKEFAEVSMSNYALLQPGVTSLLKSSLTQNKQKQNTHNS
jgi:hypothetical protein